MGGFYGFVYIPPNLKNHKLCAAVQFPDCFSIDQSSVFELKLSFVYVWGSSESRFGTFSAEE